ncbi:acetyl-CoA carboxylase family protein [Prauserella oleivorans]|uniref:acetyl-CoA carboxylase family protein n=1 Tax=Prauserella oleivorans TaxID=1478153 RepID=UPI003610C59A
MPVSKLLVANRGEIAVRILDSAAVLGIPTVAVHPGDDADCAHVHRADEALRLDGSGPAAYLDAEQLVRAAQRTGCDAVHPGYGFLSENAAFAARCARAGITFVGPDPETIELLGDKARARARARELGIPVLDGTDGPTDLEAARAFLDALGPGGAVMVKALAGGGGRGMRPVLRAEELPGAFERARSEAENAFGDGALYVERLLPHARHIEVQLVGDGTGAVTHLGDRDCSVQRRRQKLVEMAPAPALAAGVRERLHTASVAFGQSIALRGLATVEFLVAGTEIAFLEVNPRIQVEHTVTEEVTGIDLVEVALRIAGGATLAELGLDAPVSPRGTAVQARVNTETLHPDGTVHPAAGVLTTFQPPAGRGVRVDTHGYAGYEVGARYDSLLAKVVVSDPGDEPRRALARAERALAAFTVAGVATNIALLRAVLARSELADGRTHTAFVEEHLDEFAVAEEPGDTEMSAPPGTVAVPSPLQGVVVEIDVEPGDVVAAGAPVLVLESMKMEHVVSAPVSGVVREIPVKAGDTVRADAAVAFLEEDPEAGETAENVVTHDPDHVRPDLAEALERHRIGLDEGRPEAVARRHEAGRRTARENIAALCDPGTFTEYGALAIAAQRQRRSLEDLIARTPADGLVTGTARVGGSPCAVMSYDYTVLAGTQGIQNHRKTDRLFELAARRRLPLVIFAEGGGGRPGDTDTSAVAQLDVPTFRLAAELAGKVPMVAVVSGYCFAGNAALAGSCDVIIATEGSSLGMGGPAMIEGGGLGTVAPEDVGPMPVQVANGVVDVLVADDAEAVATTRRYLSYFTGATTDWECADQRLLRHLVPENRLRAYDVRPVIETLVDTGSLLELRAGFGVGIITALARLEGRPVGLIANNPRHLGGAIDGDPADKAARFLTLCQAHGLPVVSLCDTPGFMVGPDAERTATVRRFGAMFVAGARLTTPLCTVVLRKGYGLGAMAMAGGDLKAPVITVSWPTGEFGGMGLEGGVRLGYRKELEAIADPEARHARYQELVAQAYERGKGLSTAAAFEIDDVIDPADTRAVLTRTLEVAAERD